MDEKENFAARPILQPVSEEAAAGRGAGGASVVDQFKKLFVSKDVSPDEIAQLQQLLAQQASLHTCRANFDQATCCVDVSRILSSACSGGQRIRESRGDAWQAYGAPRIEGAISTMEASLASAVARLASAATKALVEAEGGVDAAWRDGCTQARR